MRSPSIGVSSSLGGSAPRLLLHDCELLGSWLLRLLGLRRLLHPLLLFYGSFLVFPFACVVGFSSPIDQLDQVLLKFPGYPYVLLDSQDPSLVRCVSLVKSDDRGLEILLRHAQDNLPELAFEEVFGFATDNNLRLLFRV
jgi:hypothetical protein